MPGLDQANVVLVARQFNPSILSEHWLVKNGILPEDVGEGQRMFVPGLVNMSTEEYAIQAVPERIQFALATPDADNQSLIQDKLGRIVRLLPHTPYSAVGLNFHWSALMAAEPTFASGVRNMFVKENSPLYDQFATDDSRFGGYLSKDALGLRMRLEIKPVNATSEEGPIEGLVYTFNFNREVGPDSTVEEIDEVLSRWTEAKAVSQTIFESTTEWMHSGD